MLFHSIVREMWEYLQTLDIKFLVLSAIGIYILTYLIYFFFSSKIRPNANEHVFYSSRTTESKLLRIFDEKNCEQKTIDIPMPSIAIDLRQVKVTGVLLRQIFMIS